MDQTCCKCASEKQISARSVEKAQELLRRMAPRPSRAHTYEESIAYRGGCFVTILKIVKRKGDPETILVAVPQSLGIIAVSAVPIIRKKPVRSKLELRLEVHAGVGSGKKPDLIGKADVLINTLPSVTTGDSVKVRAGSGGDHTSLFRRRIDWAAFRDCAVSNCLGIGTCLPIVGTKIGCVYCLVKCVLDSIVDGD